MDFEVWLTLGVTGATIVVLALELISFEIVMVSAVTVLMIAGVVTPEQAVGGFGSPTVLTIGALLVVGAGVRRTGILTSFADSLFGRRSGRAPLLEMMYPAAGLSAFLNNTPIVAMFAPTILDWCNRNNVAPSRMLMPLSYATILGGMCTLIGTSTTLVVDGLMRQSGLAGLAMFEISWVGVPLAVSGIVLIALLVPRWMPDRRDPVAEIDEERREFLVEMLVDKDSPLIDQSIAEAGLRSLTGLFLMTIERQGRFLGAVSPEERLQQADRLVFAGVASTVIDLRRFVGLSPAPEAHYDPTAAERRNHIFEAVVSRRSPLVDTTLKDVGFRRRYDAAVIAVHRAGLRLSTKIGEVELKPGDTLMLEAHEDFDKLWANSLDFSLISRASAEPAPKPRKAPVTLLIVVALIAALTTEIVPIVVASFAAATAMVLAGVLTAREARRAVSLSVLIIIACAMGLGRALQTSGAANELAGFIDAAGGLGPLGLLAAIFLVSAVLNAAVGNVASAAIVFPVALAAAASAQLDPRPFAITVAVAASCSFLTPTAYATNLMVYGPGGYRFGDFSRLGAPLTALVFVLTLLVVPAVWPL